jgi:copper(I)-binding protein
MHRSPRSSFLVIALAVLTSLAVVTSCSSSTPTRASSPNAVAGAKGLVAVLSPTISVGTGGTGEIDAVITNAGTADDALIGVNVPASLASGASVDRIVIPTGGLVALTASGPHVTLSGVKDVAAGTSVSVTFIFEKVGDIVVNATVR